MTLRQYLLWAWAELRGERCNASRDAGGYLFICRRKRGHPGRHWGEFLPPALTSEDLDQAIRRAIPAVRSDLEQPSVLADLFPPHECQPRRSGDHDLAEAAEAVLHARIGRQYPRRGPDCPTVEVEPGAPA